VVEIRKGGIINERGTLAPLSANNGPSSATNLGVLAFGDSITNGGGELQWGVALQSWALWVARALGVPFTNYAVDGATVDDVVECELVAFERTNARPHATYDLGCLYIGVNDVRAFDWDPARFEPPLRRALEFLAGRCELVLTVTAPLDLGRPRAGAKVRELNAIVVGAAGGAGALVLDLSDFGGRNLVMADHVHPTAFGQIAIAERALAVLAGDGLVATVRPRELIRYETSRVERLRGDMTFAYRHAKVSARAVAVKARLAGGSWRG
jgi:lysophospholipase L1-like esterase